MIENAGCQVQETDLGAVQARAGRCASSAASPGSARASRGKKAELQQTHNTVTGIFSPAFTLPQPVPQVIQLVPPIDEAHAGLLHLQISWNGRRAFRDAA